MSHNITDTRLLLRFNRMQSAHCKRFTIRYVFLQQEDHGSEEHDNDADRSSKPIIAADLTNKFVENKDRNGFKPFTDQHRCTKVSKCAHEYEQTTG
ncbi:hypothetical protein D3C71_2003700 [compost metagenome]